MNDAILITRAFRFATERHSTQRRKGEAEEPYVNHLAEVADLVAEATQGSDCNLIVAALLHDTIEDTPTKSSELSSLFNDDIAHLVEEVTDDKTLPKEKRKETQVLNAHKKSTRAKLLKIADKTSNLRSIATSPPSNWDTNRKKEYIKWAVNVFEGLQGVSPWLETQFNEALEKAQKTI